MSKKSDYIEKISNFLGPNFEKIETYSITDLENDVESYRTLINKTFKKQPTEKCCRQYASFL